MFQNKHSIGLYKLAGKNQVGDFGYKFHFVWGVGKNDIVLFGAGLQKFKYVGFDGMDGVEVELL